MTTHRVAETCDVQGLCQADARTRTGDPFITSEVLYQLSYVGGAGQCSAARRALRGSEAVRDDVVVERQPVLVRIVVLVRLRRQVDERALALADVLDRVVHAGRDAHQRAVVLAEVEDVQDGRTSPSPCGRRRGRAEDAREEEEAIVLLEMDDPAANLIRPQRDEVRVDERVVREPPARIEDLAERAALVGVRARASDLDPVDRRLEPLAVGRDVADP